jgi:hypothetical protein
MRFKRDPLTRPGQRVTTTSLNSTVTPIYGEDLSEAATGMDGAAVLDNVAAFLDRFVAFPSPEALTAVTLWAAHTHAIELFDSTPRLAVLSAEPGSGKTRLLELLELLVLRPVATVNCSPAYLIRRVGPAEVPPTLLYDEIDTVFGPKARDNEDVRGLLNAGHRRGAVAHRCVHRGNDIETEDFPAFSAVALAGLDDLPETLMTRSVIIRMRRRAPNEELEAYRPRINGFEGEALRDELAAWVSSAASLLDGAFPHLPEGVADRAADVWEPLLAVAEAAGGDWPERARVSCVSFVSAAQREAGSGLGIRLLGDLRTIFGDRPVMFTDAVLNLLNDDDEDSAVRESGWSEYGGHGLTASQLAKMLGKFGIKPRQVRSGDTTRKGYRREDLHDAWSRYLPPLASSPTAETAETIETLLADQQDQVDVDLQILRDKVTALQQTF